MDGKLLHETVEKFTKSIKHGKLVNEIVQHLGNPEIYKNMGSCLNPFIHSHLIWNFIKCSALLSETV